MNAGTVPASEGRGIGYLDGCAAETDRLRELVSYLGSDLAQAWQPSRRRVLLAGIGASHAALATPMVQYRRGGLTAWRTDCSDLPVVDEHIADIAILLSQSGRSTETVDLAQRLGTSRTPTLAITNTSANPLTGSCDQTITLGDHADSRVSTVGFVLTYAALAMLTDLATTGTVDPRWQALPDIIDETLARATPIVDDLAGTMLADGSVDVVASADQLTTAEAVALLFREGPLVPAAAYDTRSYLHGPMDCAGSQLTHLVIGRHPEAQLTDQLAERSNRIILMSDTCGIGGAAPILPTDLPVLHRVLVSVCVLQRLVATTAQVRGNPIDDAVFTRQDTKIAARS